MTLVVDRTQVLAYRARATGLDRRATSFADLDVLALGAQDTPAGAARLVLANRLRDPGLLDGLVDGGPLAEVWGIRGAPHLHPAKRLRAVALARWPVDDDDARARLGWDRRQTEAAGGAALDAIRATAAAVTEVVTDPAIADDHGVDKGILSRAVTERIPGGLSRWCRGCQAVHVHDQLLRLSVLPGGARIVLGSGAPLRFVPITGWGGVPRAPRGTPALIADYLRLLGPAGPTEVAAYLGTTRRYAERWWPNDVKEVAIDPGDGQAPRRAWIPADAHAALARVHPQGQVRLIGPSDPIVQARDRDLLLPDRSQHKALWPVLGAPGSVVVDGAPVAIWRAKTTRSRLDLTVTALTRLSRPVRSAIDDEAERLAGVRGSPLGTVTVS